MLVALVCFFLQARAQLLSEEELIATMNRAFELNKGKNYSEALDDFLIVSEGTRAQRTEDERITYNISKTMACRCYEHLQKYKEAYLLAKNILKGNLSEEQRQEAGQLYAKNGAVYACRLIRGKETGKPEYEYGREILNEVEPYADDTVRNFILPKIPLSWYLEGAESFISHDFQGALICYEKASAGYQELGMTDNEISALKEWAYTKNYLHDVDGAVGTYIKALTLARETGDNVAQLEILKRLLRISDTLGDMPNVRAYTASMDSLMDVSPDNEMRYSYYGQKGDEAISHDQFRMAEQWYLKAKDLAEEDAEVSTPANKDVVYAKLRDLYYYSGSYEEALLYGRKQIVEYHKNFPEGDANYYLPYIFMAGIYEKLGDKEQCLACIDTLFMGEGLMTEPEQLSMLYNTRARCSAAFKDYASALADYRKADEILSAKYPQSEGDRIALLPLIGGMEYHNGDYAEAERYYRLYADYTKSLKGIRSMDYINALIYLANAEGFAGHVEAGCNDYTEAVGIMKSVMRENLPYMTGEEREGFWSPLSSVLTLMTPYALEAGLYQTPFTRSSYDALIMSKAFLLETERSLYEVVKKEGTGDDMSDYMALASMKNQMKEWEKDYNNFSDSILYMSQKAATIETRLIGRCRGYGDITSFMDVDYAAVRQALRQGDMLVDFADYVQETSDRRYAAYIVTNEQEYPLLRPLFSESQIDSLGISRPDMFYDAEYASGVLRLLWEPLREYAAEGSTVYYVPSQLLFKISLESLPLPDGSLLGSHYNFVRLSSVHELVNAKEARMSPNPQTAVLYGGLQYDLEPDDMAAQSRKYDLSGILAMRGDIVRGDSTFRDLPWSKEEIDKVGYILENNKWHVTPYTGANGTEESFYSMHGNAPQLLHIATHGFYYTPVQAENIDYLRGYTDAMLLSGLVMSGGNAAWRGKALPDDVLGGILTANNIARLDLSGVELVVLSACQSGQGEVTSEGLYGLQRAFKKAGVGTMVMALWKISDKVATNFMVTFYECLADKENCWDKRKAFGQAVSAIREKYPDPFYWAAFVMLD